MARMVLGVTWATQNFAVKLAAVVLRSNTRWLRGVETLPVTGTDDPDNRTRGTGAPTQGLGTSVGSRRWSPLPDVAFFHGTTSRRTVHLKAKI